MNRIISNPSSFVSRLFLGLILLFVAVGTSGCFEIEEKISLKKDGSGRYSITMDLSEVYKMISAMGEMGGENPLGQMDSAIDATAQQLRESKGISNVTTKSENYVITIAYDFENIDVINQANEMGGENPMMMGGEGSSFDHNPKKRIFKRITPDMGDLLGALGTEEGDESMEMAKMMLGGANYSMTYQMPGRVKKMTNQNATISDDGKTVTLKASFLDLLEGKADLGNEIVYKKR